MKKLTLFLILTLAVLCCLAPAAQAEDAAAIRIGIIHPDPAVSAYHNAMVADLRDTFTAEAGYDASFILAEDAEAQAEAIRGMTAGGAQYILLEPVSADKLTDALTEAKDAGVRVFLYGAMAYCPAELYTAAVVSDPPAEAETAFMWLQYLDLPEYRILYIRGDGEGSGRVSRFEAFLENCASEPSWTVVSGFGGDGRDPAPVQEIVRNALAKGAGISRNSGSEFFCMLFPIFNKTAPDAEEAPDGAGFNVLCADYDKAALAAVEALDEAGISHGPDGDVTVLSFGASRWALEKLLAGEWNCEGIPMPFCGAVISEMIKVLEAGGSPEYLGLDEQKMMRCTTSFMEAASVSEEIIDWMGLEEAEPEAE